MKSILKILAWISGLLLLLIIIILAPVERTDYRDQGFYTEMMTELEVFSPSESENNFWMAGWAKANMTPAEPVDLVGYKPRGPYEFVQDSSYVKTLLLSDTHQTVALINYELLIVHPHLANEVQKAITDQGLPIDQVVFSATHTHSGMGGYIPGLMGKVAFGGHDKEVVQLMVSSTLAALEKAALTMDTVTVSYAKTALPEGVNNRLIQEGQVDSYIRQLIFEKPNGQKGTFLTYSAHATGIHSQFMGLSGDYPFYLMQAMENADYELAIFGSGAVGSHSPNLESRDLKRVKAYAADLDSLISERSEATPFNSTGIGLSISTLPMPLPEAHYRISDNVRLRPWVFNSLFGETNAQINYVKMGNTLLLSTSGEVSGMFMKEWETLAEAEGLNLIITTFNGGYAGYIIPDEYYDLSHHEARDMNWYGPHAGSYFGEVFQSLILKAAGVN